MIPPLQQIDGQLTRAPPIASPTSVLPVRVLYTSMVAFLESKEITKLKYLSLPTPALLPHTSLPTLALPTFSLVHIQAHVQHAHTHNTQKTHTTHTQHTQHTYTCTLIDTHAHVCTPCAHTFYLKAKVGVFGSRSTNRLYPS